MLVPRDVALGMEEDEGYALGCAFLVALRISRLLLVSLDEELPLLLVLPDRVWQRHVWNHGVHLGPLELGLLAVVHRQALHQQRGEAGAGAAPEAVEHQEALQPRALVSLRGHKEESWGIRAAAQSVLPSSLWPREDIPEGILLGISRVGGTRAG